MRVGITLALAVAIAACGKSEQSVSYKDSEGAKKSVTFTDDGDKRVVKGADGKVVATGTKGAAAATFPPAAPRYPGSQVQSSVDMPGMMPGRGTLQIITQATSDPPTAVVDFYKAKAAGAGLPVKEQTTATGPVLLIGKPDKLGLTDVTITAMPTAGGTSINISHTK